MVGEGKRERNDKRCAQREGATLDRTTLAGPISAELRENLAQHASAKQGNVDVDHSTNTYTELEKRAR